MKDLIDVLLVPGEPRRVKRGGKDKVILPHPCGLGIIADDNPRCLELVPIAKRVANHAEQGTTVTIEELPPEPTAPGREES